MNNTKIIHVFTRQIFLMAISLIIFYAKSSYSDEPLKETAKIKIYTDSIFLKNGNIIKCDILDENSPSNILIMTKVGTMSISKNSINKIEKEFSNAIYSISKRMRRLALKYDNKEIIKIAKEVENMQISADELLSLIELERTLALCAYTLETPFLK